MFIDATLKVKNMLPMGSIRSSFYDVVSSTLKILYCSKKLFFDDKQTNVFT